MDTSKYTRGFLTALLGAILMLAAGASMAWSTNDDEDSASPRDQRATDMMRMYSDSLGKTNDMRQCNLRCSSQQRQCQNNCSMSSANQNQLGQCLSQCNASLGNCSANCN